LFLSIIKLKECGFGKLLYQLLLRVEQIKSCSFVITSEDGSVQLELEKHFSKAYKRLYCYLREKLFQFSASRKQPI